MKSTCDIIVIGGGIAGISAAWALAEDAKVLLVERERQPGYHATGRSAAYFAPAYGNATVRNLTAASAAFFETPPDGFTDVALIRQRPAIFIARSNQKNSVAAMAAENPSLQSLDAANIAARVPIIDRAIITQGLLEPAGGDLDVDATLQAFLRGYRQRGGEVRTGISIDTLDYRDGLWTLNDGNDALQAPIIVNAAGAWADSVARAAGIGTLGISPRRRTALLVDPPEDTGFADWPMVLDVDEQFYFKPDAGQLLISPADETLSEPCDAQPDELDVAIAIDRFTQVTSMPIRKINHRWAGLRTFAPDRTFVVGFDPRAKGFFWLAGQGGYGVQSAPGMAQLAKHLLLRTPLPAAFRQIKSSVDVVSPERLIG